MSGRGEQREYFDRLEHLRSCHHSTSVTTQNDSADNPRPLACHFGPGNPAASVTWDSTTPRVHGSPVLALFVGVIFRCQVFPHLYGVPDLHRRRRFSAAAAPVVAGP